MNNSDTEISIEDIKRFWIEGSPTIIHCGAHLAEELEEYEKVGWRKIVWIEANPNLITRLTGRLHGHPNSEVVNATLWSTSNEILTLKIANNSYSSSILDFGTHAQTYPEITYEDEISVQTETLDAILSLYPELDGAFLVLDLQGVEIEALKGARNSLAKFDFIYTEVSESNLYQDQGTWESITNFLTLHDFKLVDWQYSEELNWGNALYQRRPSVISSLLSRRKRKRKHQAIKKTS
jgi:FkbM family methyltransferase